MKDLIEAPDDARDIDHLVDTLISDSAQSVRRAEPPQAIADRPPLRDAAHPVALQEEDAEDFWDNFPV